MSLFAFSPLPSSSIAVIMAPLTWMSILEEAVTQWLEAEEAEPDGMTVETE